MNSKDILWQPTVAYNPQENGLAECVNRILLKMIRSMLADSDLSVEVWSELLDTAAYLRFRTPNKHLEGKTPYEVIYRIKPDLSHLRAIGCVC